jgi:hypothetical protein
MNSNDKIPNPNENVFEFLNKLPAFKGNTAVLGPGMYLLPSLMKAEVAFW